MIKILIFGNVGAGKTTISKSLQLNHPFEIIAIDDFRRKYSNGTHEGELNAREKFFSSINENKNQFIECLGVGIVADKLFELLYPTNGIVICLVLICSLEICNFRVSFRNWDIPFPDPIEKLNSFMHRASEKIAANEIENLWRKRDNTFIIKKNNETLNDLENILIELTTIIQNNVKYG